MMKPFYLNRKEDHTGISGTGIVARGVILPSGKCVMEWQTKHTSVAVYDSIDEVRAIHGHDGKTEIKVLDDAEHLLTTMKKIGRYRVMDDFYAFGMMDGTDEIAGFLGLTLKDNDSPDFGLVAECATCARKRVQS
jgi:hypothetical protein